MCRQLADFYAVFISRSLSKAVNSTINLSISLWYLDNSIHIDDIITFSEDDDVLKIAKIAFLARALSPIQLCEIQECGILVESLIKIGTTFCKIIANYTDADNKKYGNSIFE